MVTVASFPDLASAELAVSTLEAEGIPAFIPNAQLVGIDWQLSTAVGGIVVQVAPEQEAQAREVLSLSSFGAPVTPALEPEGYGPVCPTCGSRLTRPDPVARRMVALSLLFPPVFLITGPAYLFARGRFECSACGALWRPPKAPDAA
jgi:Putative prokaryotic signal transducing protein